MHALWGILADVTLVIVTADSGEAQEGFTPRILLPDFASYCYEDDSSMFPEKLPPPQL